MADTPKIEHLKGEPQAMVGTEWTPTCKVAGCGDNTWFNPRRHVADPILFFDTIARYSSHDQLFFMVLVLLMFGLVLM